MPIEERSGRLGEAFNVRLEELCVVDLKFLEGRPRPTLAVGALFHKLYFTVPSGYLKQLRVP